MISNLIYTNTYPTLYMLIQWSNKIIDALELCGVEDSLNQFFVKLVIDDIYTLGQSLVIWYIDQILQILTNILHRITTQLKILPGIRGLVSHRDKRLNLLVLSSIHLSHLVILNFLLFPLHLTSQLCNDKFLSMHFLRI